MTLYEPEPAELVHGDVQAWGIGRVVEFGNGYPGVTVELECDDGTTRQAKAPWEAIVTYPIPFRPRGRT